MNSPSDLMIEEVMTRFKNALRRIRRYVIGVFIASIVAGLAFYSLYTRPHLTALQRMYMPQYRWSTWRSYFSNAHSKYWTLVGLVHDPVSKQDVYLYPTDEDIDLVVDDEGNARLNDHQLPIFRLTPGTGAKGLYYVELALNDRDRYTWLRRARR